MVNIVVAKLERKLDDTLAALMVICSAVQLAENLVDQSGNILVDLTAEK